MPVCRGCGNRRLFSSSKIPPAAPTANGPSSGVIGTFAADGQLETVTGIGTDGRHTAQATAHPRAYFDTCLRCGSLDLDWD